MSTLQVDKTEGPWTDQRWEKKKEGIEKVIEESIFLITENIKFREVEIAKAKKIREEAKGQIGEEETWEINTKIPDEYGILNAYSRGVIAERIFELDNQTARLEDCISLLEQLKDKVLNKLFDDFKGKFLGKEKKKLNRFTKNYVFRVLLDQISTDVNLIQQATQQRQLQLCPGSGAGVRITHQGFVLKVAQVLAMNAIKPSLKEVGLGLTEDTKVITLLQNGVNIRLIPYQNMMLISVPYGAMNSTCDWLATDYLAIPHEIGHHLFWFKRDHEKESFRDSLTKKLSTPAFKKLPNFQIYLDWLEELFADAYGCRISGPIAVLSFQELLANGSPTVHKQDDDKHPFPALRPFIQTKLLLKMGQIEQSLADKLDENWENWVQTNWKKWLKADSILEQEYEIAGQDTKLTGKDILDQLEPFLDCVAKSVNQLVKIENWTDVWTKESGVDGTLDSLYRSFTEGTFLNQLEPIDDFFEDQLKLNEDGSMGTVHPAVGRGPTRQTPRFDRIKELELHFEGRTDDWVELMLFANWSKEGPDDSHSGR